MRIRNAMQNDIEDLVALKKRLLISKDNIQIATSGFLLDTTREQFFDYIANAETLVLEDPEKRRVAGFVIILPDTMVRHSVLWQQKDLIEWQNFNFDDLVNAKNGYLDQIAVLPDRKFMLYAPALAFQAVLNFFNSGHDNLFSAVLNYPFCNSASVSMLRRAGAKKVGRVSIDFPGAGSLGADVYHLEGKAFLDKINSRESADYAKAQNRLRKNKILTDN